MVVLFGSSHQVLWAHHRSPYFFVLLLALGVHLLLFALTPPFQFKPYVLVGIEDTLRIEDVINPDIPPEPKDVPLPPKIDAAVDDTGTDEDVIPPTMFNNVGELPLHTKSTTTPDEVFFPFDEPPIPIHYERPVYPALAREAGFEGVVHVKVVINANGKVVEATVMSSNATKAMEQAALKAAYKCLFEPAKQNSIPVPVAVVVPFEFRLIE